MSERPVAVVASVPKLAAHMRLRFDKARDSWSIQAPERAFMLDTVAHEIVSRCDGTANIAQIVDSLCAAFGDAPRDLVEGDVLKLIQDFADKSVILL